MPNVFWAALGGSIGGGLVALIVEGVRWFLNRPLVQCRLYPGFTIQRGVKGRKKHLFYEAANRHSKPVTLSSFGLAYERKEWGRLAIMPDEPYYSGYQLDGGKSLSQQIIYQSLFKNLRDAGRRPRDLKYVWFGTQSGSLFRNKIEKWVINELEKEFQKINKRR